MRSDPVNSAMSKLIPLIDAIIHGDFESLTTLAAALPQDQLNSALLRCFMFSDDARVLSILVNAGADINHQDQEGRSAIFLAVKYMRVDVIQLLIELGCNVNLGKFNQSNCLHLAARRGNVEIVQMLLDVGHERNVTNWGGNTALLIACRFGHTDVVERLLIAGCDPMIPNKLGHYPLHYAAFTGEDRLVEVLLAHRACADVRTHLGIMPVMLACERGHCAIVQRLASRSDLSHREALYGGSALHWAVAAGCCECVRHLLSAALAADSLLTASSATNNLPSTTDIQQSASSATDNLLSAADSVLSAADSALSAALAADSQLNDASAIQRSKSGTSETSNEYIGSIRSVTERNSLEEDAEGIRSSFGLLGDECSGLENTSTDGKTEDGANSNTVMTDNNMGWALEDCCDQSTGCSADNSTQSACSSSMCSNIAARCDCDGSSLIVDGCSHKVSVKDKNDVETKISCKNSDSMRISIGDSHCCRNKTSVAKYNMSSTPTHFINPVEKYNTVLNKTMQEMDFHSASASMIVKKPITECNVCDGMADRVKKDEAIVKSSLSSVYTIDLSGRTPLLQAVQSRRPTVISILLEVVDLHSPSNPDVTVLHMAAACGYRDCVETLCSNPRSKHLINTRDCFGETPLDLATAAAVSDERPTPEVVDVIDVLLRYGAERSYEGPLYGKRSKLSPSVKHTAKSSQIESKINVLAAHDAENSNSAYFIESAASDGPEVNSNVDFLRKSSEQDKDDASLAADLHCMNLTDIKQSLISIVNDSEKVHSTFSPVSYGPMQPVFKTYSPVKMALIEMLRSASCEQMVAPTRFDFATWLDTGPEAFVLKVTSLDMTDWLYRQTHSPWSLRELCRGAVRRTLGYRAHEKVQLLPLPKVLQNYLNMTELDEINTKDISIRSSMSYEDVDME